MSNVPSGSIDVGDPAVITYWAEQLGVTEEQLKRAIEMVGPMPAALEFYLAKGSPRENVMTPEQRAEFEARRIERQKARDASRDD